MDNHSIEKTGNQRALLFNIHQTFKGKLYIYKQSISTLLHKLL